MFFHRKLRSNRRTEIFFDQATGPLGRFYATALFDTGSEADIEASLLSFLWRPDTPAALSGRGFSTATQNFDMDRVDGVIPLAGGDRALRDNGNVAGSVVLPGMENPGVKAGDY